MVLDLDFNSVLKNSPLYLNLGVDINRVYMMFVAPDALQTVLDFAGDTYPTITEYLRAHGAKHAHEIDKPGAYGGEYISYEKLEELRRKIRAGIIKLP